MMLALKDLNRSRCSTGRPYSVFRVPVESREGTNNVCSLRTKGSLYTVWWSVGDMEACFWWRHHLGVELGEGFQLDERDAVARWENSDILGALPYFLLEG